MTTKLIVLACFLAVSQAQLIEDERPDDNFRIIGGSKAKRGEFPHQVSLQWGVSPYYVNNICGGSIIKKKWILTAAHCLEEYDARLKLGYSIFIAAGKYNLNKLEISEQVVQVESYFMHEKYDNETATSPYDLGLIKLKRSLKLNKRVAPINLAKKNTEPTGLVVLSGWGATNNDTKNRAWPKVLQKVNLEIIDRDTCSQAVLKITKKKYAENWKMSDMEICTGPLTGGFSGCNGDSGGGLVRKREDGKTELVGIAAWVIKPCGRVGSPTVYIKVSSFIDWIEKTISKN